MLCLFACKDDELKKEEEQNNEEEIVKKHALSGVVEKGPFVSGSSVTINELGEDLSQTGKTYTTTIKNGEGMFELKSINLKSPYTQLSVDGFFFNEIGGTLSKAKITLYALADVRDRSSVNVNIVTHIQKQRLEALVAKGTDFLEAKKQTIKEIGQSFYLTEAQLKGILQPEDMKLTENNESSKILLAISSIMIEGKTEAQLTQFLTQYSNDLADNGVIDNEAIQKAISESSYRLQQRDIGGKRPIDRIINNLENYYKTLGKTVNIPNFSSYVDHNKNKDLSDYKNRSPFLTFKPLVVPYTSKTITTDQILAQVFGKEKEGYTLKSITSLNPSGVASVSGTKPNLSLTFVKAGTFTATLVLEHSTKVDVTINNAKFEITKVGASSLTFSKRTKTFSSGGSFSTDDIFAGVIGNKNGYTLKSITSLNPSGVASVSGAKPYLALNFTKVGAFTATIVLEHATKPDTTITGAKFEIAKASSGISLAFSKRTKTFNSGGSFSTDDILAGVIGNKNGYTLKNVTSLTPSGVASVSGTKPYLALNFTKVGAFTATIVLEHAIRADVTITGAKFEITKASSGSRLTFSKRTETFASGGSFSTSEILAGVGSSSDKAGYTLKNITSLIPSGVARVGGTKPNLSLTFIKAGSFTATIVLEHPTKGDATINNASFEITKAGGASLTFSKRTKTFISGWSFTTADILAGVQGSGKGGYTLKSIASLTPSGVASVSGTKPNLFLTFVKPGSFTATIVLEHPTKADVTINNASFEIGKASGVNLTFSKRTETFTSGGSFSTSEILAGVQGSKAGYTLKSIASLTPSGVASVSGTKPNLALNFTKAGAFTATIVLEHSTKADVTIDNAAFEIGKASAASLTFNKVTKTFASGGSFSTSEILSGVQGTKTGYTLKSIASLNPSDVASVSGTKPNLSLTFVKAGSFTATLVLEHSIKADVTINNAAFETSKAPAPSLTFNKITKPFDDSRISRAGGYASVDRMVISSSDILANIQGNKNGYTLKSFVPHIYTNLKGIRYSAQSFLHYDKRNKSQHLILFQRAGTFTSTIVLEHPGKEDVTITNAQFEITRGRDKSVPFNGGKKFTIPARFNSRDLSLHNSLIKGRIFYYSEYRLKSITNLSPSGIASVLTHPNLALKFIKPGTFTATLVFEHHSKDDLTITGAKFEITKTSGTDHPFGLTFSKRTETFTSGGSFTTNEILAGVQGSPKDGYTLTLKNITSLNPSGVASVSGTKPNLSLTFVKPGTFTANIVLEYPTASGVDYTIRGQFEINKGSAASLTFNKVIKTFVSGGSFTTNEILAGVQGSKAGYTLKSIHSLTPSVIASVSSVKPNLALHFTKAGTFTATIVLEHPTKADVTINNAAFEIVK